MTKTGWWLLLVVEIGLVAALYIDGCLTEGTSMGSILILGITAGAVVWYADATKQLAISTQDLAESSNTTVEEMKKQGAPSVVFFFSSDADQAGVICAVLKNFGRRPAYNVEIEISPPLKPPSYVEKYLDPWDRSDFQNGVPILVPGQCIRTVLCVHADVFPSEQYSDDGYSFVPAPTLPLDYDVQVTWLDKIEEKGEEKPYQIRYTITLRDFAGPKTSSQT